MPISIAIPLEYLDQDEFKQIAHEVVGVGVDTHRRLGRFFDETVYQRAVAKRLTDAETEVKISVTFRDFQKEFHGSRCDRWRCVRA